jgi:CHAT domain-containing protein
LWNVNDAATAELMKAFYGNLKRGVGAAEALRWAKLGLANGTQRAWRHPYFWAGFVFVGDGGR